MKIVNKWNFKEHKYYNAEIDDKCSLYEDDMDKIVKCPNCNKDVKFGDCYTSKQYHNDWGLGYAVCEKCYEKEWELYMEEITIPMEEYKELLIIKGKYEELKSQQSNVITYTPKELTRTFYGEPIPKEEYKITCKGEQH